MPSSPYNLYTEKYSRVTKKAIKIPILLQQNLSSYDNLIFMNCRCLPSVKTKRHVLHNSQINGEKLTNIEIRKIKLCGNNYD